MHRCRPRRLLLYGDSGGLGASWRPRCARIASNVVDQAQRSRADGLIRATTGRAAKAFVRREDQTTPHRLMKMRSRRLARHRHRCRCAFMVVPEPAQAVHGLTVRGQTSARRSWRHHSACRQRPIEQDKAQHRCSRFVRQHRLLAPAVHGCAPGWPCDCRWPGTRSGGCDGSRPAGRAAGSSA